jgi:hypothetical protein
MTRTSKDASDKLPLCWVFVVQVRAVMLEAQQNNCVAATAEPCHCIGSSSKNLVMEFMHYYYIKSHNNNDQLI